ncbi:ADP-ribosylation factor 8B [Echinococcus multilocularis]|uniref:ADP-ribosylation factor 8B n=1 Tax=Echinococcus multilocularis TaxID=6211 RepID=A0A0S4MIE6_ECHMU|nr:ADP-ribosylation factor 8B [Echinococcus multilocularis]
MFGTLHENTRLIVYLGKCLTTTTSTECRVMPKGLLSRTVNAASRHQVGDKDRYAVTSVLKITPARYNLSFQHRNSWVKLSDFSGGVAPELPLMIS